MDSFIWSPASIPVTCRPHFRSIGSFCNISNTVFDNTSYFINASTSFIASTRRSGFPLHSSLSFSPNFLQLPSYHFHSQSPPIPSFSVIFHWFWGWLPPTLVYIQTPHLPHFFCHALCFANCTVYFPSPLLIPSQFSSLFRTILHGLLYLPLFPLSLLESTHSNNSLTQSLTFPTIRHRHIYLWLQAQQDLPCLDWHHHTEVALLVNLICQHLNTMWVISLLVNEFMASYSKPRAIIFVVSFEIKADRALHRTANCFYASSHIWTSLIGCYYFQFCLLSMKLAEALHCFLKFKTLFWAFALMYRTFHPIHTSFTSQKLIGFLWCAYSRHLNADLYTNFERQSPWPTPWWTENFSMRYILAIADCKLRLTASTP